MNIATRTGRVWAVAFFLQFVAGDTGKKKVEMVICRMLVHTFC